MWVLDTVVGNREGQARRGLTLCMLGKFSCFRSRLLNLFKTNFLKKIFQEHYQSVKRFRSRSGPTFCRS